MRKQKLIILLLGLVFIAHHCSIKSPDEADFPSWFVELNVPLYEDTFYADSLLDDSSIVKQVYQGDSIFAFQDTSQDIERQEVGDQLEIDDINQTVSQSKVEAVSMDATTNSFSYGTDTVGIDPINQSTSKEIGNITLDNTSEETDPISFDEIYPGISSYPSETATIPEDTGFPPIYRPITFSNFQSATFSSGEIVITVNNDLVVEMGRPITIQLCEEVGNDTLELSGMSAEWVDDGSQGIMPNTSDSRSIDLSGKQLPDDVIVKIEGVLCGSGPETVDTSEAIHSSFNVGVETNNLTVESATAKIPPQEIDTSNTIQLTESDNKVEEATILSGNLNINIGNQLGVDAVLHLNIDNLYNPSGTPFHDDIPIDANTQNNSSETDINGYSIVMPLNDQKIDYSYTIETVSTGDNMAEIQNDDSVSVDISLYGEDNESDITFQEFKGIIAQEPIVESGDIVTASEQAEVKEAVILSGNLDITVDNQVNKAASQALPTIDIQIHDIYNSNDNPISITGVELENGNNSIQINQQNNSLANYTIRPQNYDTQDDQAISYTATVTIPSDQPGEYNLLDSIDVNIDVTEITFNEVTGKFDRDPIIESDSIAIDEDHKLELAEISQGQLVIDFTNNLGVEANIDLNIPNIVRKDNGNPFSTLISLTATGANTETVDLSQYNIELDLKNRDSTQYVFYTSQVNISSSEEMTLDFGNNIDEDISLNNLKFDRITGYIDTVEVELDSTEQEISALPDEMDGINLQDVNIMLDLNTNVGVQFQIDLTMEASNEEGDFESIHVIHTVLPDDPTTQQVTIPNAEDLLNIKPDKLVSFGSVKVFGQGTVRQNQFVTGKLRINVPLIIEFQENATLEMDPEITRESDFEIPDNLDAVKVSYVINNGFDFGGSANILAAKDTNYFKEGSQIRPDTLVKNLMLQPNTVFQDSITLNQDKFDLFTDSLYVKPKLNITGLENNSSRLLKTDSIKVSLWGTVIGKIDTSLAK